MSIKVYNRKRNFGKTPEPKGKERARGKGPLRFVVQMHHASRLHFDLRLEFDGVFKSWAVPRGPSLNPLDQRLAVFVEDHPIEYGSFEGIIPKGNYGAGTVMVWDEGTYVERGHVDGPQDRKLSDAAMMRGFEKGHMTFVLDGHKLKGEFALIKLKKDGSEKAWLLVKKRDEYSSVKRDQAFDPRSVKTGRTMDEIADQSEAAGNVWLPKQKKQKAGVTDTTRVKKNKPIPRVEIKKETFKKIRTASDPMPRKNKPMIPTMSRHAVGGKGWLMERSLGGLRALAEVEGKRVHLYSKAGISFDKKFQEIVKELGTISLNVVLDGEVIEEKNTSTYFVYDLLYHDGHDLRKKPLSERRAILEEIFPDKKTIKVTEALKPGDKITGPTIAKNLESIYHAGTTSDWLIVTDTAQVSVSERPRVKTKIARIEKPITQPKQDEARLTNLDKVFWPEEGITKGDLIDYYKSIAPFILPYLKDRPESLNRQPNGIAAPGFYQKDMTGYIPRWLKTERIFSESADKSIDYVVCQDERSLLYIVNLGCIEINPWFSRVGKLEYPDYLVIDLDPDGNSFDHVMEIAHEIRAILDKIGAKSFCKTSGATGIHIGVPTGAKYDFDQVRELAEAICRIVAKKYPATTSVERNPNRRKKKIYLDFMQNRRGQTLAAPYCVRPRKGAPVSMPLQWKELRPGLRPEQFNINNALSRIKRHPDPWKGVLGPAIDLAKCLKKLK